MKTREIIAVILLFFFILLIIHIIILLILWVFVARRIFHSEKIVVSGEKRYVFIEKQDVTIDTNRIPNFNLSNEDGFLGITSNSEGSAAITIYGSNPNYTGYAWDGCSPKFQVLDLLIGTPDGAVSPDTEKPLTYKASMVHDVLYQYHKKFEGKITRKQVDGIFLDELEKAHFLPARMYYMMVRTFGWIYWRK
jgi:hypothetical protein